MAFKRILIAIDGSETASLAIRHGVALASGLGAEIRTIFVFEPMASYASEIGLSPDELLQVASAEDVRVREALDHTGVLPHGTEHLLRVGHPATMIDKEARNWPADLIVMGSHGRGGLGRVLLGSVAEHVVRHAPCPVLVIPQGSVSGPDA